MASLWEVVKVESSLDLPDEMKTYVSHPGGQERCPAVIVIQEAIGVNQYIQAEADRLAAAGYFAVAPALYHREDTSDTVRGTNPIFGYGPEEQDERIRVMGNLTDENVILDINATISWLMEHPRVLGDRIGIVGFCLGGRLVYLAATACPGLGAASMFYAPGLHPTFGSNMMGSLGDGPSPFDRTPNIQCPLLGNFGDLDLNVPVADMKRVEAELQKYGKTYDFKIYSGAGHSFYCSDRATYHRELAEDAWAETLNWFKKYLAPS